MNTINKIIFAVIIISAFSFSAKAFAATMVVNDPTGALASNAQCSITEAILNANANNQSGSVDCPAGSGIDTILLNTDITFTTPYMNGFNDTSATPFITESLVINGQNHTLDRNSTSNFRFFHVTTAPVTLSFKNMIMENGSSGAGGFMYMVAMNGLAIDNVQFIGGVSGWEGGAIYANGIANGVTIQKSKFENNSGGMGGALFINEADTKIQATQFLNNDASAFYGGAITVAYSSLGIVDSTLDGNTGGAIHTFGGTGATAIVPVRIEHSTLSNNETDSGASVIRSESSMHLTMINTTVSGNENLSGPTIALYTGDDLSKIVIAYSTFYGNASSTNEGVIKSMYSPIEVSVENSIFAANAGGDCNLDTFVIDTLTNNRSSDATCGTTPATGVDPVLANNGGTTKTHKLLTGSNAIDTAINTPGLHVMCPKQDQRHSARMQDGNGDGIVACDIGAYEYNKRALAQATTATVKSAFEEPTKKSDIK